MSKNFTLTLPELFTQNAFDVCGEKGKLWLNNLPQIIKRIEADWSVTAEQSFPNLSYNYVAPCFCADGSEAVLKIGLPLNNPEIFNEASFLQIAAGKGAVKLLNFDKNQHAMLLEKLTPGANLKEIYRNSYPKAVEIAISVIRNISRKKPSGNSEFLTLEDWFKGFERAENTKFPREFIFKARWFIKELNSKEEFLIHGDLHHENILSAGREPYLIIDPKGVIGNIEFEISVFLNNHRNWLLREPKLCEELCYAVRQFSEAFEIKPQKLIKWAFVQSVLSIWWTFEDNGKGWEEMLNEAQIWEELTFER